MSTTSINGTSPVSIRNAEEIQIPVPWGFVSGKWWGPRDRQPILAIHGWQDNAGTFDTLMPLLPADLSVLCIDLPGHGLSSHYPPGQFYYLFWDGLLLVRRIVAHFKWKKVSLIGHSLGGAIGFLYAATYPNDVEDLICIDIACPTVRESPKITGETGGAIDRFLKYEHLTESDLPCYSYEEMVDLVLDAYRGALTRDSCKVLMRRGMAPVTLASRAANGAADGASDGAADGALDCASDGAADGASDGAVDGETCSGYHFCRDVRLKVAALGFLSIDLVLEYASRVTCRYMNIKGRPGMTFDRPEYYQQVLDNVKASAKHFEFHEVDGTHHLHLNNPERISPLIIDFLDA